MIKITLTLLILLTGCNNSYILINGFYDNNTKTVVLNKEFKDTGQCVREHELFHHRQYYPEEDAAIKVVSNKEILSMAFSGEKPPIPARYACKNAMELEAYAVENKCRLKHGLEPVSQEYIRRVSQC